MYIRLKAKYEPQEGKAGTTVVKILQFNIRLSSPMVPALTPAQIDMLVQKALF